MIRALLRLIAAVSLFALPLAAQDSSNKFTPAPLLPAVEKAAADLKAGGFVLAELNGSEVSYVVAGKPDASNTVPPERRIFEIGSITKVFTGLLLAQASLEGKVALDDPIGKFLPPDLPLDPNVAAITLAQLSSHTSGLPRLPDNLQPADQADPYADYTVERLYAFLRGYHPQNPAPQPSDYSNLGAGLLGHVLTRVYGVSYGELVRAKITGPLGLADTVIELSAEQQTRFVTPYSGSVAVPPWRLTSLAGAGALRSTAADLVKFLQALLDEHSAIAPAWNIASARRAPFGARGHIGLGILMATRGDETVFNHSGGTGGFRTYFEIVPATKRGTVLLLNNDTIEPAVIVASVRRPPAKPAPAPEKSSEVPLTAEAAQAFTGVYSLNDGRAFTVVVDDAGRVRIRLTGQVFLPVVFAGKDLFSAQMVGAQFQFERDERGQVASVTLRQGGIQLTARRSADAPVVRFLPMEKLREYAGSYELQPGVIFEITASPLSLVAKLTGQQAFPVHCTQPDRFVYDIVDAALTFERDSAGAVVALVLHQNGLEQRAARIVPKK